ncbi:MAG: ABC transporter ATP-binding protein, partial [Lachnospiraceae bacterium]|nr:ABC transporter ATP-binding protein [Lachnospiraceae bacterium]
MKKIWKKMMVLLDRRQKKIMVGLVFLMLIGAVLETMGVGMVVPVMQVVMDENAIQENAYLQVICRVLNLDQSDNTQLMVLLMLALIGVFVLKNIFLFFQQKAQLRFVYTNQFATSRRMMINFMQRPYEYYLNADTAVIQRSITSDVNNMYGLILSLLQLVSEAIVFVCLAVVSLSLDA